MELARLSLSVDSLLQCRRALQEGLVPLGDNRTKCGKWEVACMVCNNREPSQL